MHIKIDRNPDFGRLRKTLLLQGKADRVPLFDFNVHNDIKQCIIDKPIVNANDEINFWVTAGYDYVQVRLKPNNKQAQASKSLSTSHGGVKNLDQLNSMQLEWTPIFQDTWKMQDYNLEFLRDIYKNLPSSMKLIVHAADIFTRSWIAMGFEDFCMALYDDTQLIEELFLQNAIAEIRMLDVIINEFGNKIGAIFYSDDLAYTEGLMLSPDIYRTYLWPHVTKISEKAKKLDVPIIYHTDGKLWELFDDFATLGVNGIQPLEPKSMNLSELKAKRGSQFCLMGSIDIDVLSRGTTEEIDNMVRERINTLGFDGGYTVGTSNTVPEYINVNNYIAMLEAAYKYGKY